MNRQQEDLFSNVNISHANIETGHNEDYVIHDLATAKRMANVVTLNEMYTLKYHRYIRKVFPRSKWGKYPRFGRKGSGDPILWKKCDFKKKGAYTIFLHSGIKGLLSIRYLNGVYLQDRSTGIKFVVRNCHYVSKAFNGKNDSHEQLRRRRWYEGQVNDNDDLLRAALKVPVISCGDYNRLDFRVMGWDPLYLFKQGLDKMYVHPEEYFDVHARNTVKINSNHPCLKAVLEVRN